jgi:hypothetical protein
MWTRTEVYQPTALVGGGQASLGDLIGNQLYLEWVLAEEL